MTNQPRTFEVDSRAQGGALGVNLNVEPEWIASCAENDPRVLDAVESTYLGHGVARLSHNAA